MSTYRHPNPAVRKEMRDQLLAAIRGAWSTRPTCWDRQVDAVMAVLSERGGSEDMRVRCTCGETACESELCDCDAVPCPVNHRVEEAEAEARSVLDRVSDWANAALDAPEAPGGES